MVPHLTVNNEWHGKETLDWIFLLPATCLIQRILYSSEWGKLRKTLYQSLGTAWMNSVRCTGGIKAD